MADENTEKAFEAIEVAKNSGKLRKGANEVTKAIEKGTAKLVAIAEDTNPKEIIMHIPLLCEEKKIQCIKVDKKEELGAAAGLPVGTTAVAIIEEGDAKKIVKEISKEAKEKPKTKESKE